MPASLSVSFRDDEKASSETRLDVGSGYDHVPIDGSVLACGLLAAAPPSRPLRVCCYGSSSSQTPEAYLREARHVGYLLARRGHVCVNGAGSFGCMAAMNDGACRGNGHIVGVIHEMWLVDGEQKADNIWTSGAPVRDGGAHGAFANGGNGRTSGNGSTGPIREMLVAGGNDLQERKRLLMDGADALLVLPGGPGTWDELWEAACARGIGLTRIPIVVVNADGYYDPFLAMLERAYKEGLTKLEPDRLIHFEDSAEGAIRWIESLHEDSEPLVELKARDSRKMIRKTSMITMPIVGRSDSWFFGSLRRSLSRLSGSSEGDSQTSRRKENGNHTEQGTTTIVFAAGVVTGALGLSLLMKCRQT